MPRLIVDFVPHTMTPRVRPIPSDMPLSDGQYELAALGLTYTHRVPLSALGVEFPGRNHTADSIIRAVAALELAWSIAHPLGDVIMPGAASTGPARIDGDSL